MSKNWPYRWMISCPTVLKLGVFDKNHFRGIATLALTLPRVVVLGKDGTTRLINRVPEFLNRTLIEKICLNIATGGSVKGFVEEAFYRTMFYGGFNIYLTDGSGSLNVVTFELVNTDKLYFYVKETEGFETEGSIENWVLFGLGLRTGVYEYIREACRELGGVVKDGCGIFSDRFIFIVSDKPLLNQSYLRVHPDNNPLRHVIKL